MLPYINAPFEYAAARLGAGADELKLVFSFLLSYPLAGLLKRVPDARPEAKNLFVIAVSVFYLVGLFDLWGGLRTLFLSSAVTYAIAYYLAASPYMPWIGFVFLMGHLSVNQLARQFAADSAAVDITGAQMVLVMKLSAFCWNVADGRLLEAEGGAEALSPFQRDRALRSLPSLLDYAGYVLFFPSLLAGPACDFAEYRRWLDTSMFALPPTVDPAKRPPTRRQRKIPRSGRPALWKMATGLAWIGAYLVLGPRYPGSSLLGTAGEDATAGISLATWLARVWRLYLVGMATRTKYYGVWALTEGACILAGLGFHGVDPATGRIAWDRVVNVRPWGVETAQNTRAFLENWNMKTNAWLRNYVYLRVTPRGRKPGFRASMATFVTSALWHGFYPGYYLTFVLASFIQTVAKNFRRYLRPFFLDPVSQQPLPAKPLYDLLSFVATQAAFAFAVAPFILLSLADSLQAWARVYFYAVVGVLLSMAVFASPVKPALKRALEARAAAAAAAAATAATSAGPSSFPPPPFRLPHAPSFPPPPVAAAAAALSAAADNASGANIVAAPDENLPPVPSFAPTNSVLGAGLPEDPEGELDEMAAELRADVEQRRRRMSMVGVATGTAAASAATQRKKQA